MSIDTQEAFREGAESVRNVLVGNVATMKRAHDALLAFGRPCLGTDEAIIQLRNSIEYSEKALEAR